MILYSATLLNSLILEIFSFLRIMSNHNHVVLNKVLLISFQCLCYIFLFIAILHWRRHSIKVLNCSDKNVHSSCSQPSWKCFLYFSIKCDVSFTKLKKIPYFLVFKILIMNKYQNFSNAFSPFSSVIIIFSYILLIW